MLDSAQQQHLLKLARQSIHCHFEPSEQVQLMAEADWPDAFQAVRGTFVTLKLAGQLRGCIGNLQARDALAKSVIRNAHSAAFRDHRFQPLTLEEFAKIEISISVLTPQEPFSFSDEADLIAQLEPGEDGLVIACGNKQATFLPSVWESLPTAESFVSQLRRKAGISNSEAIQQAWRYRADYYSE